MRLIYRKKNQGTIGLIVLLMVFIVGGAMNADAADPVVRMETSEGNITVNLDPENAPLTTANFLYYVTSGFYDGTDGNGATIFHRVVDSFVIQGGGFTDVYYTNQLAARKPTLAAIPNEANNGLSNTEYTIAMARTHEIHSATCQFFINTKNNSASLDYGKTEDGWGYAVFGEVDTGRDVVDAIEAVDVLDESPYTDAPVEPIRITRVVIEGMEDLGALNNKLYYPHVASDDTWETDICVINGGTTNLKGLLRAFHNSGQQVSGVVAIDLPPNGRADITVKNAFPNSEDIGYITLESNSPQAAGYTKFYVQGTYRVAVPAVKTVNSKDIFIPHVASDAEWWTGAALVNTTSMEKPLTIVFDTGTQVTMTLPALAHYAFTIRGLFQNQPQPDIKSGIILGTDGVIGLELFGSTATSASKYLSGILMSDKSDTELYFPHLVSGTDWWTGIVAFNTGTTACTLKVRPFDAKGTALDTQSIDLPITGKFVGTVSSLQLPGDSAWIKLEPEGETECDITGFELFGTLDGNGLAGYSAVGIKASSGVFPKLDKAGWTGIAMVNTEFTRATVTLTAMNDAGGTVAAQQIKINSRSKLVDLPQNMFDQDITAATYVRYSSDRELVAFQLNGSSDGNLLDGLPALNMDQQ